MKCKIKQFLLIFIVYTLFSTANVFAAQTTSNSIDNSFAVVTKGKINKHKVKPGDTLKYSITITDMEMSKFDSKHGYENGFDNGIYDVTIIWQSPKKQRIKRNYQWYGVSQNKTLKISGKIKINKGMQQGQWKLEKIYFNSGSGEDEYETACLYDRRSEKNKYEYDCVPPEEMCEYIDLSFADFKVSGTGKKVDSKGPVVSLKSLKVSKPFVKVKQKSVFSLKVKDQGEINEVVCYWDIFQKGGKNSHDKEYIMKYNKKKKIYQCSVKMGKKEHKAKLNYIYVEDIYGNGRAYSVSNVKSKKAFKKMVITRKKK